jgi:hypothetical protein
MDYVAEMENASRQVLEEMEKLASSGESGVELF